MKKASYLVAGFVVALALGMCAVQEANADPTIALGTTFNKSKVTYGEVGVEIGNWELNYGQLGEGTTDYGYQQVSHVYSASHLVRPPWCIKDACAFFRIGAAFVNDSPLIGTTNYRLGFGVEWNFVRLEYFHFSSAGIWENNGGIDGALLKFELPL